MAVQHRSILVFKTLFYNLRKYFFRKRQLGNSIYENKLPFPYHVLFSEAYRKAVHIRIY